MANSSGSHAATSSRNTTSHSILSRYRALSAPRQPMRAPKTVAVCGVIRISTAAISGWLSQSWRTGSGPGRPGVRSSIRIVAPGASRPTTCSPSTSGCCLPLSRKRRSKGASGGISSCQSPWSTYVLVRREELGACPGSLLVELDGHERHRRRERRDDPRGPNTAAGAELANAHPATLRGEHVQQQPDLADTGPLEPELALERECPLDERRVNQDRRSAHPRR